MSEGRSRNDAPVHEAPALRLIESIARLATDELGVDSASVTARRGEHVSTVFAGDQRFLPVDQAQYATGEGPCLTVLAASEAIAIEDLRVVDPRWPAVAEVAVTVGAVGNLSVPVPLGDAAPLAASVNLYTASPRAWSDGDLAAAARFAERVGDVLASAEAYRDTARLAEGLAVAMRTRAVIEQAKGVIMAATGVDADEAFAILKDESQHTNVKLREVATAIVERARRGERATPARPVEDPAGDADAPV